MRGAHASVIAKTAQSIEYANARVATRVAIHVAAFIAALIVNLIAIACSTARYSESSKPYLAQIS